MPSLFAVIGFLEKSRTTVKLFFLLATIIDKTVGKVTSFYFGFYFYPPVPGAMLEKIKYFSGYSFFDFPTLNSRHGGYLFLTRKKPF